MQDIGSEIIGNFLIYQDIPRQEAHVARPRLQIGERILAAGKNSSNKKAITSEAKVCQEVKPRLCET